MRTIRATVREFWGFVAEETQQNPSITPCWEWTGPHAYSGYMAFRSALAHRAAATIYCGQIPTSVKQRCGNKKCVRLDHFAIALASEEPENRFTPTHKQQEVINNVLSARGNGRYTLEHIKSVTGYSLVTIKKVLREAPLYDLLADMAKLKAKGQAIQMEPTKKVLQHA